MNERHIRHNHLLPSFLPSSLHGSFIENEKANRRAWPTYIRITITKAHLLYRRPIRYSAHACRMKLCISHFSSGRLTIRPWRSSPWMPFVEKPRNYPSANLSGSCVIQLWSLPPSSSRPPTPSPPGLFNLVSHPALSLSRSLEFRVYPLRARSSPGTDVLIGRPARLEASMIVPRDGSKDDAFARHLLINDVFRGGGGGDSKITDVGDYVTSTVEWRWRSERVVESLIFQEFCS